ncbi:Regulatory P domain of the subtilisin-like proprotein convertases and other protease [unidentified eubacterium SCB49]|nr:Regulatory P domain of the subtilisin-like proprotein convertases and other protease [unidentified eubacterium SCB49]
MNFKQLLKKNFTSTFFSIISISAFAQTPCENGFAGPYPCSGYDLVSEIDLDEMDASSGNDSWGWTDPQDGKEYALVALDNGTAFIDISNPTSPIYLGKLPTHTGSSIWRDVKTYQNHAYVVSDVNSGSHGMQVFDLTRLRNVTNPPEIFTEDAHYNEFGNAHNIVIHEETGYAYAVGTSTYSGGGHYIDISDPTNPVAAGGSSLGGYTHDAQVVIYDGPDSDYNDGTRELYFGSNEDRVVIMDVTDKDNPIMINEIMYANDGYTHQGWLTEDHRYFILGDETDELGYGFDTRTIVFDLLDMDATTPPRFEYYGPTEAIDHNVYVRGDRLYLSNYRAGLRILDISDIANGNMVEEGYFDTYPANDSADFDGAWSVYPYFESGNIVISDINRGFILVKGPELGVEELNTSGYSVSPNPATTNVTIKSQATPITSVEIYNVLGQEVLNATFENGLTRDINIAHLNTGMYLVKVNQETVSRLIKN